MSHLIGKCQEVHYIYFQEKPSQGKIGLILFWFSIHIACTQRRDASFLENQQPRRTSIISSIGNDRAAEREYHKEGKRLEAIVYILNP
jgi:hypothetical protein